MALTVDLNADLGNGSSDDVGLLSIVTSANVACGAHAGSPATMRAVCAEAVRRGITLGALVSYADRAGAGLAVREAQPDVLSQQVADQVGALAQAAREEGGFVTYVKVHGALQDSTAVDAEQASAVLTGSGQLPVLGIPGSLLLRMASESGRGVRHEGLPDRRQAGDGTLLSREEPGAVVEDSTAIARRALELAPLMDSLSLHGNSAHAVEHAQAVRACLMENHWTLRTCWLSTMAAK